MNKEDYAKIFLESHPGFFEGKELKDFPEGRVCEEMFLPLEQYDETRRPRMRGNSSQVSQTGHRSCHDTESNRYFKESGL